MRPLDGWCALVTGASAGIGWEISRRLAARGACLVIVARDRARLEKAAATLAREHGVIADALVADLADSASPGTIAADLGARGMTIDILVNNAGYGLTGRFSQTSLEEERTLIRVDVDAVLALTKLFLPGMLERRRGRILSVASTAAFFPGPLMSTYYASKAFVLSWSTSLASELEGSGVTATCLCPGPTRTDFAARAGNDATRLFRTPLVMNADAVAEAGVRAMLRAKAIVVPGFLNQLLVQSARITPRWLVTRISRHLNENA